MWYIVSFSKNFSFICFVFLFVLGLPCCVRVLSSCGTRGSSLFAVCGLLTAAASPAVEHRLGSHGSCGSGGPVVLWLVGMKPVCPAMTGRFPTTQGHQRSPCVVSFSSSLGVLPSPRPGWKTQPRCAPVLTVGAAQQANQSVLRDGCVMPAERFLLQLLERGA